MWETTEDGLFHLRKRYYGLWTHILARISGLTLKTSLWWICFRAIPCKGHPYHEKKKWMNEKYSLRRKLMNYNFNERKVLSMNKWNKLLHPHLLSLSIILHIVLLCGIQSNKCDYNSRREFKPWGYNQCSLLKIITIVKTSIQKNFMRQQKWHDDLIVDFLNRFCVFQTRHKFCHIHNFVFSSKCTS